MMLKATVYDNRKSLSIGHDEFRGPRSDTLRSSHTRAKPHVVGLKLYTPCSNCNVTHVTPAHILMWVGDVSVDQVK
ncbi:hypothetical protein TNCV_2761111 [Trichonephila clavipes]|nr:hypothetical protein TNCV_2761111 [Trichonephila clavipes]